MITARPASPDDLVRIWDHDLARHPCWPAEWKDTYIALNQSGKAKTFGIFDGGQPIGTGTLLFSPECGAVGGRAKLADGKTTAHVNALRIDKPYESRGHISALVKQMERYAASLGYTALTIGVASREKRSRAIYRHWGYGKFITLFKTREGLILNYAKKLTKDCESL